MRRFAFIMHPQETEDYFYKFPLLRKMPKKIIEKTFRFAPPLRLSEITGMKYEGEQIEGFLLACPLTARQISTLPPKIVEKKITEAINLSLKLGVELVGLGGQLAVAAENFTPEILENSTIPITTGTNFHLATLLEKSLKKAEELKIDVEKAGIAIIGATSLKGSAIAQMLAKKSKYLTLVSEYDEDLIKLTRKIMYEQGVAPKISRDIENVLKNNDIIILAVNVDKTIINPEHIKAKSIITDLVKQRQLMLEIKSKRKDLLYVEAGAIKIPEKISLNFDFGLPQGLVCASISETMILALENKYEKFTLGNTLNVKSIKEISKLAKKHDFELQEYLDII